MANSGLKDGVHLTPDGYRLLARLVADKLRAAEFDTSKVICFGDSLTKGSATENYPAMLQQMLTPTFDQESDQRDSISP